jgi:hypothetical protein
MTEPPPDNNVYPNLEERRQTAGVVACDHCSDQIYIGDTDDRNDAYVRIMEHYDNKHDNFTLVDGSDIDPDEFYPDDFDPSDIDY